LVEATLEMCEIPLDATAVVVLEKYWLMRGKKYSSTWDLRTQEEYFSRCAILLDLRFCGKAFGISRDK
jgi:hypothetical protein